MHQYDQAKNESKATFDCNGTDIGVFHVANSSLYAVLDVKDRKPVKGLDGRYTNPTRAIRAIERLIAEQSTKQSVPKAGKTSGSSSSK